MGWGGDRFYLLGPAGGEGGGSGEGGGGAGDGGESGGLGESGGSGEGAGGARDPAPLPPAHRLRGLWLTAWDTPADRGEFNAAYLAGRPDLGATVILFGDRAAAFLYGFTDEERAALEQALLSTPPAFAQGGAAWTP